MRATRFLVALLALNAATAAAQKSEPRESREVLADDPQLLRVLLAAVDYVFDDRKAERVGFAGVFIRKKLEPSVTSEVVTHLNARGLARLPTTAGCEQLPSRTGPTPPAGVSKDGTPLQPAATGTTKPLSSSICNRGYDYTNSFHMVRIAGDSAFVETRVEGVGRSSTQCVALVVAAEGGWKATGMQRTKIGQCGK